MAQGEIENVTLEPYRSPSGEEIQIKTTARDLRILATNDLLFRDHIDKIVSTSRIVMGMLLRTFSTREKEPMMKLFNTYIRSRLEYCCVVWAPVQQGYINELEAIQKTFTSKITGMEKLDYHERLKNLNLYSLERRRDRYAIIYGWQQLEGIKPNIMGLKSSWIGTSRRIISRKIPVKTEGREVKQKNRTKIYNCPARRTERLFNSIPPSLKNRTKETTEIFKGHLDRWLREVPDLPRIGKYSKWVAADTNSVTGQAVTLLK